MTYSRAWTVEVVSRPVVGVMRPVLIIRITGYENLLYTDSVGSLLDGSEQYYDV